MHQHRHFNLLLYDDDELEPFVQGSIVERVTLHEWPLSCVQRLTTSDGRRIVYKAQFGPTVESQFYANAKSDLLISGRTIYQSDGYIGMLLEFVEAPLVENLDLSEGEIARIGRTVTTRIAEITGDLPCFIDVSTEEKWATLVEGMLSSLNRLVSQGAFNRVSAETIRKLECWSLCEPVLSAVCLNPGYAHQDLGSDNIFVSSDGYRVIDWQRPILGPPDLDMATLLETSGVDPFAYVDESIVWIMHLLRIHWSVQCAMQWFPQGRTAYDEQIVRLASLIGVSRSGGHGS